MKILFLPKHEYLGASSRYRTLQYLPYIKKKNVKYDISPLFSDEYLRYKYKYKKENKLITLERVLKRIKTIFFDASKYDVLVIEKELLPYFPPVLEYFLKIKNISYVVDYDDAVWHNYDNHRKKIIRKIFQNKIKYVMKNANTVIAGSNYIIDYAQKANVKKIVKIPTVIDLTKYICRDTKQKGNQFIVGWIGSPSSSQYILEVNSILESFTKKYEAIVHLVGFDKNLEDKLNFNYKIIPWTEESEVNEICKFDIGIMPLPDTPFERGKCGFKLIQYMGCKKAVIASPIGENNSIVDNGINGYLAKNSKEWEEYLVFFYSNRIKRDIFGVRGYEKARKEYSLVVNQEKYLNIILENMGK